MNDAVILSTVRTAVGRYGGALAGYRDTELGSTVMREAVHRAGIDPAELEDVYFGNILGLPGNPARVAALGAGIPQSVPAVTVDRQCASSLETLALCTALIRSGEGDLYLSGGCESMSNRPYLMAKQNRPYSLQPPAFLDSKFVPETMEQISMGETAENILDHYPFSREELDAFALESHMKAAAASDSGRFDSQIIPLEVKMSRKESIIFDKDESIRPGTSMERLAALAPLFRSGGSVTAGNSCPMNDGASAQVICSRSRADALGRKPLARVHSWAHSGLDYKTMGLGPVYAVRKLLGKTGIPLQEIGLIELNEAFSSQSLACIRELGLQEDRVNVNGGALALGHPLAATGGVLVTKILDEMERRDCEFGLVTMCIGGGQGTALLLQREG